MSDIVNDRVNEICKHATEVVVATSHGKEYKAHIIPIACFGDDIMRYFANVYPLAHTIDRNMKSGDMNDQAYFFIIKRPQDKNPMFTIVPLSFDAHALSYYDMIEVLYSYDEHDRQECERSTLEEIAWVEETGIKIHKEHRWYHTIIDDNVLPWDECIHEIRRVATKTFNDYRTDEEIKKLTSLK